MLFRIAILIILPIGLVVGIRGLSTSDGQEQTKPQPGSKAEGGMKLVASIIKEHFGIGEPILVKLVLKNDSSEELRLVATGLKDYKLDVRDEQGELRPLTVAGETLKRNESFSISKGRIALRPGEEREEGEISVTDRFNLTEPGKYEIIVRRSGPYVQGKRETIESNKITVTVE